MSLPFSTTEAPGRAGSAAGVLWAHRWFLGAILAYCLIVALVSTAYGRALEFSLGLYTGPFAVLAFTFCFGFLVLFVLKVMVLERPKRLIAALIGQLRHDILTKERLLPALLVIVVVPLFISAFTSFKALIPAIHPFSWDPAFAAWDRALHGGLDPWRLMHPLLGTPAVTSAINALYHAWYFVFYGVLFWQAFSLARPVLRMRFLISFVLTWAILGSLFAVLLSSAGPVYYGRVTGLEDPYRELMAYLALADSQTGVMALNVQELLWDSYQQNNTGFGSGISAMPSVHVGLAVLLALVGWQANRVLGWGLILFAVAIQIGSVHLGWHYAIDGYLATLLTILIWWAVGWFVRRFGGLETRGT